MKGGCKQEKRVKIDSGFILLLSDMFCIWVSSKGMQVSSCSRGDVSSLSKCMYGRNTRGTFSHKLEPLERERGCVRFTYRNIQGTVSGTLDLL